MMLREDLRLLFDTEKRMLRRRLAQFFPKPASTAEALRHRGSKPARAKPTLSGRTDEAASTRKKFRGRSRAGEIANWAISIVLHLVVLAIVYPYLLPPPPPPKVREYEVNLRLLAPVAKATEKEDPATPVVPDVAEVVTPTPPVEKPKPKVVEKPVETPTPVESSTAPKSTAPKSEFGIGAGADSGSDSELGSRSGEQAQATRLSRFGGGADTQAAVRDGLEWLANHQNSDGSWDADNFHHHCGGRRCRGSGYPEYKIGVTALATLAFLGAGEDGERATPHKAGVRRALGYLISEQDAVGCVGPRRGNYMYNHAIAAFCLAEAAVLTQEPRYLEATQRALKFSGRTQQLGGGWDYTAARTLRNDLSVTGWQVMAIDTASKAGISVEAKVLRRLQDFISRSVRRNGWATYADRGTGQGRGGVSMVAVGALSKLYLGWTPTSREISRAAEIMVRHRPDPEARTDWVNTFQTKYYWYYATLALFHTGGDYWDAWNTYLKRHVLPLQRQDGHEKGSWDPDPSWIGAAGGRVSATALGVLMFEVYYRYDPIHEKRGSKSRRRSGR